jgi:hypothetical protein
MSDFASYCYSSFNVSFKVELSIKLDPKLLVGELDTVLLIYN